MWRRTGRGPRAPVTSVGGVFDEAAVVPLRVLGVRVDLRAVAEDPGGLAAVLRDRWHLCLRSSDGPGDVVLTAELLADGDEDGRQRSWKRRDDVVVDTLLPRLLQRLTQSVTHAVIGARTGDLLMFHAAALCDPASGATAVFIARGNTGKTTLCRTLGPGRGYVTDETVGVRRDGTVEAYPKPLSVRRCDDAWATPGVKDEQAPGDVGLVGPEVMPWVAGMVLLDRDEAHEGPPVVDRVDLLDAVVAVTPETSAFMRTEAPLQRLAEIIDRTGGMLRVTYAEVCDLEGLVQEITGRRNPWVERRPGPQAPAVRSVPEPVAGRYLAVPPHDELRDGSGESLVLLDGQVRRVSAMGTVIRDRAVTPVGVPELTAELEGVFGAPAEGDAEALTRVAVDSLVGAGLLVSG